MFVSIKYDPEDLNPYIHQLIHLIPVEQLDDRLYQIIPILP